MEKFFLEPNIGIMSYRYSMKVFFIRTAGEFRPSGIMNH